MSENGQSPNFNRLGTDVMKHIGKDSNTVRLKKKYNTGVAIGVGMILLTALVFCYLMYIVTSDFTLTHVLLAAAAAVLMIAAIIVVSVRLKRLQADYFTGAEDSANEFVEGLVKKMREDSQKKAEDSAKGNIR